MSKQNRIILIGKLKENATQKVTNSGDAYANFKLSVDRPAVENIPAKTDELEIVCWGDLANNTTQYSAGSLLLVSGSIKTRNYENNEGKRIYVTEVEAREIQLLTNENTSTSQSEDIPVFEEVKKETPQDNFNFNDAIKMDEPSSELGESVPF